MSGKCFDFCFVDVQSETRIASLLEFNCLCFGQDVFALALIVVGLPSTTWWAHGVSFVRVCCLHIPTAKCFTLFALVTDSKAVITC